MCSALLARHSAWDASGHAASSAAASPLIHRCEFTGSPFKKLSTVGRRKALRLTPFLDLSIVVLASPRVNLRPEAAVAGRHPTCEEAGHGDHGYHRYDHRRVHRRRAGALLLPRRGAHGVLAYGRPRNRR